MTSRSPKIRALALAGSAACLLAAPLRALEWSSASLPTFARGAAAMEEAHWPDAFASSVSGMTGQGANAATYRIGKDLLLGVSQTSGSPALSSLAGAPAGFDFSSTSVKLGFDMGRLTPFVTTTLSSFKASALPGLSSGFNTTGDLMAGQAARTGVSAGAGFNFAVSDSLHLSVGASVGTGRTTPSGW
jgi:outer membrane immunogenic protein